MHPIPLAVDARDLACDIRGIGRYTRAILRRLAERADIELTLLVRGPFAFRHHAALQRALRTSRFRLATRPHARHVVWHPANGTFFGHAQRSVATIHDLVPFRFPAAQARKRREQQQPFIRSVRNATRFIAVSQFGKSELVETFGLSAERIEVIYHGVEDFFCPGCDEQLVDRPYLLFVGDPLGEPRKNFRVLYEAYTQAFAGAGPELVVVGSRDPELQGVRYAGAATGDALGEGDAKLRALYRNAVALCLPSYYETFGMPMVEAMACGTPVIASRASCLPEIGGDAARFEPPSDPVAWRDALLQIISRARERERLRQAGLERARRYDWDQSARRHAEVFASV